MRTLITLIVAASFSLTAFAQQSTPRTKPDPELKKLTVYVGQWRYEGEYKPGPLGPGGKATGNATGEMILRGFFLEWRWKEKANTVETEGFEILNYDPMNRNYASTSYADDGSSSLGAYVFDGNTSNYSGKFIVGGKQYLSRVTEVFAADLASFTQNSEISIDGKIWTPFFEAKFNKAKPAPKK
jgi:hypothetical protein